MPWHLILAPSFAMQDASRRDRCQRWYIAHSALIRQYLELTSNPGSGCGWRDMENWTLYQLLRSAWDASHWLHAFGSSFVLSSLVSAAMRFSPPKPVGAEQALLVLFFFLPQDRVYLMGTCASVLHLFFCGYCSFAFSAKRMTACQKGGGVLAVAS